MGLDIKDLYFSDFKSLKYEKSNKKIILFGAGVVAKKILNNFPKKKIEFIVDNNQKFWKTKFEDIIVKNPDSLKSIDKEKYFVLICTTSFSDVTRQLDSLGLKTKKNFGISHFLKDLIVVEQIQSLKKNFLISSGLPPENKPLRGGGLYKVDLDGLEWKQKKIYSGTVHGLITLDDNILISDSVNGLIILDKNFKIKKKRSI